MAPITPRYISPKERAENRARILAWLIGSAIAIPLVVMVMLYGYSDQAPRWLREAVASLDAAFGFPVLWLIKTIAAQ
jgi:hypothetical protein